MECKPAQTRAPYKESAQRAVDKLQHLGRHKEIDSFPRTHVRLLARARQPNRRGSVKWKTQMRKGTD